MSFQALVVIGMIALVYGDLQQYLDDYPACGVSLEELEAYLFIATDFDT